MLIQLTEVPASQVPPVLLASVPHLKELPDASKVRAGRNTVGESIAVADPDAVIRRIAGLNVVQSKGCIGFTGQRDCRSYTIGWWSNRGLTLVTLKVTVPPA